MTGRRRAMACLLLTLSALSEEEVGVGQRPHAQQRRDRPRTCRYEGAGWWLHLFPNCSSSTKLAGKAARASAKVGACCRFDPHFLVFKFELIEMASRAARRAACAIYSARCMHAELQTRRAEQLQAQRTSVLGTGEALHARRPCWPANLRSQHSFERAVQCI